MGTRISVGIDGSKASRRAVEWAAIEAGRCGDELVVTHVCEVPIPTYGPHGIETSGYQLDVPGLIRSDTELVDDTVQRLRAEYPDLDVVGKVERGEVGRVLIDRAADSRLLVVGAHERHLLTDIILGSNTRYVLHHATTNVVVVPQNPAPEDQHSTHHIAVGVDGSAPSTLALVWAAEEASRWGASLHAVHTWDYPPLDHRPPSAVAKDFEHQAGTALRESIEAFHSARCDLRDLPLDTSLVCGPAAQTLLSVSKTADLLVVGHRGRSEIGSLVLGSVAFHVAQHSTVPVVVVRRPDQ